MTLPGIPDNLAELIADFQELGESDRLQLLLELSDELPPLPERYADHPELLEPVPECQSPLFLTVEVAPDETVSLFFSAPPEAPTTRGFANILHTGLDGLPAAEILAVPDTFPEKLGLTQAVSMLRMRGMHAMLGRVKRQITEKLSSDSNETATK